MAAACDDGSFCNGTETCDGSGVCGSSTGDPCPSDNDGDCADACNDTNDDCTANVAMGGSCNAELICNPDTCDGVGVCTDNPNATNGTVCSENMGTNCNNGVCQ